MERGGKELAAEIRPLKEAGAAGADGDRAGAPASEKARRLSRWRTAAFFLSLFLCLGVLFVFSFVIPCPVRPVSQRTWSRAFPAAAAYKFLEVQDVDQDRVQDVLFALRASDSSRNRISNRSCADEGFTSPCASVVAISGTDGRTLWARPVAKDLLFMGCSFGYVDSQSCLVAEPASLSTIDLKTGETQWRVTSRFGSNTTVLRPLLNVPDVNGDSVPDILVFASDGEEQVHSTFYSGRSGDVVGSNQSLNLPGVIGHLMHVTDAGADYVLFYTADALYGYSLKELHTMAAGPDGHQGTSLEKDPKWEAAIDRSTHRVRLLSSGEIHDVMNVPHVWGTDILIVRSTMLELLNGQRLKSSWTSDTVLQIQSKPALGSFTAYKVDIVVENRVAPDRKKVLIVEGTTGKVKWDLELFSGAETPAPVTLCTVDHRSIFLFWGDYQPGENRTESVADAQNLYLFHPIFPNVLLGMNNSTEKIVVFEAVLFERSRHAGYVLLTGPKATSGPGLVTLSKRKLKEDIAGSRVIWQNQQAQDTDENIRARYLRMKFRSP